MTYTDPVETATFTISIDGQPLGRRKIGAGSPGSWAPAILAVHVEEEVNLPTMFSFQVDVHDFQSGALIGLDLEAFKPGANVSVSMGLGQPKKLVSGKIMGLEPRFGKRSTLLVRGFDKMYNLHFGTKQRTFLEQTDSQIAATIAAEAGLTPAVEDSSITYPFVLQNDQSNYEFLLDRAGRVNYEMRVEDDTFYFQKSRLGEAAVTTLKMNVDIETLALKLRVLTKGSQVKVRGWDVKQKQLTEGEVSSAEPNERMGGRDAGFSYSPQPSATAVLGVDIPDMAAADQVARSIYSRELNHFIVGEGSGRGNPDIKVGTNIEIDRLGPRFNGRYYVTATRHAYSMAEGYRTGFQVRRTGI